LEIRQDVGEWGLDKGRGRQGDKEKGRREEEEM
jgi:hypothetical protein